MPQIDKTEWSFINKILFELYTSRKKNKYFTILEVSKEIDSKFKKNKIRC